MSRHPILPGFHPDPSICRVGDSYVLATSSFEYHPGIPIFTSTDLVTWTQVGNALDRPGQLADLPGLAGASRGVYAPTVRHHDGLFWLVTTDVNVKHLGHILLYATDPAGPWSDPVHTTGAVGIDPDLAWDGADCYLTWKHDEGGIWQALVEPTTGRLLSEPAPVWSGTGLAHTEGPHLIRRGAWWYLLVAEGGTDRGHAVSVARSSRPGGPFEPCPANPIFSHRSLDDPLQSTGHADLVQNADGSWAMVHLGVRVRGSFPRFHVNGRESFLTGIDWVEDWPVVVERYDVQRPVTGFSDSFEGPELHPRWVAPGTHPLTFARLGAGGLELSASRKDDDVVSTSLLATRALDEYWTASAVVTFGDAALVIRLDDAHWFGVERVGDTLQARAVVGPFDGVLGRAEDDGEPITLVVRATLAEGVPQHLGPDTLEAGFLVGDSFVTLGRLDGRYLSTEVAGGFTGRVIGVEALNSLALVSKFSYRSDEPTSAVAPVLDPSSLVDAQAAVGSRTASTPVLPEGRHRAPEPARRGENASSSSVPVAHR